MPLSWLAYAKQAPLQVEESLLQGDSSVCEGTGCATSSSGFWWGILRVAVAGQYKQEREEEGREKDHEGAR